MVMKMNISYPATGMQKVIEIDDEKKLQHLYDRRMAQEVDGGILGDEFKGYVMRISGGNDKQGFPMKQGILTNTRVRLLLAKGQSCYRPRRRGERKRVSVRGCIVGHDISVLNLVVTKKGDADVPGLTDDSVPRRLGPKRASKIRNLFNLTKEDDVRKYVIAREFENKKGKKVRKAPKIQRLITPLMLQRKRQRKSEKLASVKNTKKEAAEYKKLMAQRLAEQKEARRSAISKRRSSRKSQKITREDGSLEASLVKLSAVTSVLSSACDMAGFDIAEVWVRIGKKQHQLTASFLRPAGIGRLMEQLNEVYYGAEAKVRVHRLSPALCKKAKEQNSLFWLTSSNAPSPLDCAISDIKTAVAVPVSNNIICVGLTVIFFSVRKIKVDKRVAELVEHMSIAAGICSVGWGEEENNNGGELQNSLPFEPGSQKKMEDLGTPRETLPSVPSAQTTDELSHSSSELGKLRSSNGSNLDPMHEGDEEKDDVAELATDIEQVEINNNDILSSPPKLDLKWSALENVEYLTDGGNTWIHTAVVSGRPVVVKTLKPECQDVALAINEIEGELDVHCKLKHTHIVGFVGAGTTSKGMRFLVLERLDGGTLTQVLGYDTRIRDRRRRFWKRRQMSYIEVLVHASSLASAMAYLQTEAFPSCMVLHRDLKPDNIGFTLDGALKLIDFGLAKIVENATPDSDDVYRMSGETGSLRYMAPEVADNLPYNHKGDVYSFGIILWEMTAYKKPYEGFSREAFYRRVVKGGERPLIAKKWPKELSKLMQQCWSAMIEDRPTFDEIVTRLANIKEGLERGEKKKGIMGGLMDRHSTWF